MLEAGTVINGKYFIIYEIGSGAFATVWIAYNILQSTESTKSTKSTESTESNKSNESTYYAIKIHNAKRYDDGKMETKMLKKIGGFKSDHINYLIENFSYSDGKNNYMCSVFELMSGSLYCFLEYGIYKYGLPIDSVKKITKQLLIGLNVLHTNKIIHTDLKPENILLKGLSKETVQIIQLFEDTNFKENYESLLKQFGEKNKHTKSFKKSFKKLCTHTINVLQENLCKINLDSNFDSNSDSNSNSDSDYTTESDLSTSDESSVSSESNEFNKNNESNKDNSNRVLRKGGKKFKPRKEQIKKINKRKQSIDDYDKPISSKNKIYNLDKYYDFKAKLNNRKNTTDHNVLIDEKYIVNPQIKISDFGNAHHCENKTKDEIQTRHYRAPEIIIGCNYHYESDLWSVGCIIFELLTGFLLFDPEPKPLNKDFHHLFLIEKQVGIIPKIMIEKSKRGRLFYELPNAPNTLPLLKNVEKFEHLTIKDLLINQYDFEEKEALEAHDFIMGFLQIDPLKRRSIQDSLKHVWIN
jgi:serine/threonine-protein kinase SRPK3